jgi:hypothetical protein
MKTKTFLLVCHFSGIAFTRLPAQNNGNGIKVVNYTYTWNGYWQPVFCDGVHVDDLTGSVTAHNLEFYRDGFMVSAIMHYYGQVVSVSTGEIFKVSEIDKADNTVGVVTWHFNLKGDKGSHYIGWMKWDFVNDPVPLKAQCN